MGNSNILNIAQTLKETAEEEGSKTAIIEARSGARCSFSELDHRADHYGGYLKQQGVCTGDRVILMVKPSIDFIALTFALFRIGAPIILIDPGMGYKNLLRCIEQVKPNYLIGIPPVVILSRLFRRVFKGVKKRFTCGSLFGLTGSDIRKQGELKQQAFETFRPEHDSLAAIIFTTGSTGPPKGVRFEHSIFSAQLQLIKTFYRIGKNDVDQPGFPLFALFSTAMGACAVIPDMDPTRPAQVEPAKFIESINKYQVSYSFGSPAIWNVVSRYCLTQGESCPSLKKVLMAGAPVSGKLIDDVYKLLPADAEIFTPYGATESLPIVSIEGREIIGETWKHTKDGRGTCVGKPLPDIAIRIIEANDENISTFSQCRILEPGNIGEIIVKGDVVTRAYENNSAENSASKITDSESFWHRIGDVGYLDETGRLWFCGRKAHRVFSKKAIMYTICCEAITNNHPNVFRSALVGIETDAVHQTPVMIVEKEKEQTQNDKELLIELKSLVESHHLTKDIEHILIHPAFPVDIRHNAKIFREKLKTWAQKELLKNK